MLRCDHYLHSGLILDVFRRWIGRAVDVSNPSDAVPPSFQKYVLDGPEQRYKSQITELLLQIDCGHLEAKYKAGFLPG